MKSAQRPVAASLFISDLHLAAERPAATAALLRFLEETAPGADHLYVLGDLFEYWIGDETLALPMPAQVAGAFRRLAQRGTPVSFMHGNRDFLIGNAFAKAAGLTMLSDPTLVDLYATRTLLMHGDSLCTDDVDYQLFREMVRDPAWQRGFLAKPIEQRVAMAQSVRGESERAKQVKDMAIMDASPTTVESVLRQHRYPRLIHGHTHRPARHQHIVDGHRCERFVLADWYDQGSYLLCDPGGCRAVSIT
ncbi:MAG: UDP-2,3-diacylglucosamine diphosphatase [Burkholderiales bacterium]